jgi:hypothetical protein
MDFIMLIVCIIANFGTLSKRNAFLSHDDGDPEDSSGPSPWSVSLVQFICRHIQTL